MLDVVIVNWNSGSRLASVVSTIAEHHDGLVTSVVVVDNASTDGSAARAEAAGKAAPFKLRMISNQVNTGFAAACNQGARGGNGEFILFLNPDTKIFERSLDVPLKLLQSEEKNGVGIVGIQLVDESGRVAKSCSRFPSLAAFLAEATGVNRLSRCRWLSRAMQEWDHGETRRVDQVMGAFFLVKRSLFEALGGFDERFFVYFEEVDFARRARNSGWSSVFVADAQAFHEGGGTSHQVKPHRLFYSLRSRLLYGFKHFQGWEAWCLVFLTVVVEPVSRTIFCLAAGQSVRDTWTGYRMLYCDMPAILRAARLP